MKNPNNKPNQENGNDQKTDPSAPLTNPLTDTTRREFVRKSLATSIIAAQPTILTGLIRADGSGSGGGGTTNSGTTYNTTYQTTCIAHNHDWDLNAGVSIVPTNDPQYPSGKKCKAYKECTICGVKVYRTGWKNCVCGGANPFTGNCSWPKK